MLFPLRLPMLKINRLINKHVILWFLSLKEYKPQTNLRTSLLHDVRDGENIVAKREKVNEFVEFLETSKSTRIHMNPRKHAEVGEKKPAG